MFFYTNHNQLDSDRIPFKTISTNIVLVLKSRVPVQPKSTILVCMIINGKGSSNGCGQHGCSFDSSPF